MVKKMKILGLILELNPLHNGHKYFIEKAIDEVKPDSTIAIISSSFSMRGDINIIDKFTRTSYLQKLGIDIILELPVVYSLNNADIFAYTTVNILKKFKITDLAFGVETNDFQILNQILSIMETCQYNDYVKKFISYGNSYSNSSYKAINLISNDENLSYASTLPNNTLAIQYLKNIGEVTPHLITRINNQYYDEDLNNSHIQSATSLRKQLLNNQDISEYIPFEMKYIDQKKAYDNLFMILKYQLSKDNDFSTYLNCKDGIDNRIKNMIKESSNYDDLIEKVKTKRYPPNRIKRVILSIILEIKDNYLKDDLYLRILGINKNGEKHLKTLDKDTKKKIITSLKNNDNKIVLSELKATILYDIITSNDTYLNEYKVPLKEEEYDN